MLLAGWGCYRGPDDVGGPKIAPSVTRVAGGPCADTSYQRMKRTPVDSLSQREFEIYRQRDAACGQYQLRGQQDAAPAPARRVETMRPRTWLLFSAGALALILIGTR